ncbi:MAG: hypothetical protein WKG03_05875 [Telluria sp.]
MSTAPSIGWWDDIECEGGAVLVANVDDFAHWLGGAEHAGHEAVQLFDPGSSCYLWRALPGSVRVSVDSARTTLCLVQVEYADDDAGRAAALAFALASGAVQQAPGLQYRVTRGPVVLAWAGNSVLDTSTAIARLPLSGASAGALIDFAGGPNAAAVWVTPGVYASSLFFHEEDRWGVSWCRLQRVSG